MKKKMKKEEEIIRLISFLLLGIFMSMFLFMSVNAVPTGPDSLGLNTNETKGTVSAYQINVSGGYIANFNLSATIQNDRWKGFVGQVSGSFTLDDASGDTIFDWSLSSISGGVYATRNESTITWSGINCSNTSFLELENYAMNHTNSDDNITRTFNDSTHAPFWVGTRYIYTNTCNHSLNTFVNDVAQNGEFDEMALDDGTSVVYATIMETNEQGFDTNSYDFQMIVPENGAPSFSGITPYYLYVEII